MIQTFDDFLIVPDYFENEDEMVEYKPDFFHHTLEVPVLSSPMDTISGKEMLGAMFRYGGLGIHHRYCEQFELVTIAGMYDGGIAVSPSMGIDFIKELLDCDPALIAVMDVAHGDTKRNLDFCEEMVELGANVVSGNIVTRVAAMNYWNAGVQYMRVGIGSGSVCSTRQVTGCGYPQALALQNIYEVAKERNGMKIISDGGHRTTGDVVKALACGADFVMLGGMLAGTKEAEGYTELGNGKVICTYRGMASAAALSTRKKEFFVEGIGKNIEPKGSVIDVLKSIKDAIEKAFYYTGSENIKELREATKIELSDGAKRESYVR